MYTFLNLIDRFFLGRYFSDKDFKMRVHSILADYFTGKWSGQKKPFRYSDILVKRLSVKANSEADRKIPRQPLKWKYETAKGIQVIIFV